MNVASAVSLGGRYELADRLAVGGMGEVWRARDRVLQRWVAVKILREEYAGDPQFRDRFRNEARHAASLVHPNVAQVFDFGEGDDDEPPYLVMELVDGEPLSELLAREAPLSPERTWSLVGQTAAALGAAHAAGVVHRDVKPGNLLVCRDGRVKVTDFGIARAVDQAAITQTGFVLGTAHYLAPEQAVGAPTTAASDLYALGVVAYECLTGRRTFDGDQLAVLNAHREQPPPPLPDSVPGALRDLVMALLAKDPAARPTDTAAIAAQAARFSAPDALAGVTSGDDALPPYPDDGSSTTAAFAAPVEPAPEWFAEPEPEHRLAPRVIAVGAVAVVVVAAVAAALLTTLGGSSGNHRGHRPPGAAQPVAPPPSQVRSVALFHPGGSAADHPEDAPLAADGKPSTAWYTQHYATAAFGNLRPGVGLVFDLGRAVAVTSVHLRLAVPGVDVRLYAGDDPASLLDGGALAGRDGAPADLTLSLSQPTRARYWLVYFSRLAPSDGAYRAGIADVEFR